MKTEDDELWMLQAACRNHPDISFFPMRGESSKPAKAICRSCPVRTQRLTEAMRNGERWGVWGGFSEQERRAMRKQYRLQVAVA